MNYEDFIAGYAEDIPVISDFEIHIGVHSCEFNYKPNSNSKKAKVYRNNSLGVGCGLSKSKRSSYCLDSPYCSNNNRSM